MKAKLITLCITLLTIMAGFNATAETLKMTDDVQQVAMTETIVNINTASVEQLMALPGIGRSKANAIITYRETQGPFTSIDDLVNVKGIGNKMLAKLTGSIEAR